MGEPQQLSDIPIADTEVGKPPDRFISLGPVRLGVGDGDSRVLDRTGEIAEPHIPLNAELIGLDLEPKCCHFDSVALRLRKRPPERVSSRLADDIHEPGSTVLPISLETHFDALHYHQVSPKHGVNADLMAAQVPGGRSRECSGITVRHLPHWTMTCEPLCRTTTQLKLRPVSSRSSARLVIRLVY